MTEEKSASFAKAEGKMVVLIFALFGAWCPRRLIVVRPIINSWVAGYVLGLLIAVISVVMIFAEK